MIVRRSLLLPTPLARCLAAVKSPSLLQRVAHPLVRFTPADQAAWPTEWLTGAFRVRLYLLGWLPMGIQTIDISFLEQTDVLARMRDNGHSALIARWDHRITLEAVGSATRYTDEVIVEAGWRTAFVWLFAQLFFWHRQRQLHRLALSGALPEPQQGVE